MFACLPLPPPGPCVPNLAFKRQVPRRPGGGTRVSSTKCSCCSDYLQWRRVVPSSRSSLSLSLLVGKDVDYLRRLSEWLQVVHDYTHQAQDYAGLWQKVIGPPSCGHLIPWPLCQGIRWPQEGCVPQALQSLSRACGSHVMTQLSEVHARVASRQTRTISPTRVTCCWRRGCQLYSMS